MDILGKITLYNDDCMNIMRNMPDKAFDLAIVDPPYGIQINKSGRVGHYGGGHKVWDNSVPEASYFKELFRVSRHQIIWGGNYFGLPATRSFIVWDKQQPESVSFAMCEFAWTSFDKSAKMFRMRPQNMDEIRIHPTQKPVALYKWLLTNYAKPGDRILDTHLGSGSICIACHDLGFEMTGIELDWDYYEAAKKRLEEHQMQQTLF